MNQPIDLDQIEARANAATPGPWDRYPQYGAHFYANATGEHLIGIGDLNFGDGEQADADEAFVRHAREDVPALLAEVRRLRARVAELEGEKPALCGRTRDISGTEYGPCTRKAGHQEAYCRSERGASYFLAVAADQPSAAAAVPAVPTTGQPTP